MSELETGFRISDVVSLVRRRLTILLGATVLGLVFGTIVFVTAPQTFSATSRVQVKPIATDPLDPTSDAEVVDIVTEQDLVKSDAVADAVRAELGLEIDNRALLRKVVVTSKEDSLVLEITYESGDAREAQDGANAFADAYLAQRRADAEQAVADRLGTIGQQIAFTRTALDEARASGDQAAVQELQGQLNALNASYATVEAINTADVGRVVRRVTSPPEAVLSKMALGKAVGVMGLCVLAGLAVAFVVDRSDSLGGGRRRIAQILPGANLRLLPRVVNPRATQAEVDAAVDRLAIELTSEGRRGKATGVLLTTNTPEPPVRLAEEMAASLAFAGIPAVFVLAGASRSELPQARVVTSFTDLVEQQHLLQAELADPAGPRHTASPTITWLRPRGSVEASGLLQRAVVESLLTRASRDGFEAVFFLTPSPTHHAAAAAFGRWVDKTALVVLDDDSHTAETAAGALAEADIIVTEAVWA
jgi:capsular polysaccharide biosynthesis protein